MRILGQLVEMGDLMDGDGRGVLIVTPDDREITIVGLTEAEIRSLPNLLYKEVALALEMANGS